MQDLLLAIKSNLIDLETNAWLGEIDELCDELGFFEQLGTTHFAGFIESGNKLLVTFENAQRIRAHNANAEPRGFSYAREEGWSHLALISLEESWFRDRAIYDFFDRMIDDAFFEDFENVIFHGADGGGYAAAAYSVAAPGASVIAIRPQATLDAQVAGWDPRYKAQRMTDFNDRFGYAPEMIDAAKAVFVIFDPLQRLDAAHAALFRKPHVAMLPAPLLGAQPDVALDRFGIHDVIIKLAMQGGLDPRRFSQLLRARRYDQTYARALVTQLINTNHHDLARLLCEYMLQRGQNPFFAQKLRDLSDIPPL
ncbi:phosphoadenosine phosphosulfate reductase [Yoonia sp.]|uniref:phosphoadenosine phosphosulfate reductase n=1 Tax=Yoonia sp. TaxID=2212373 RepID=UPI0019DD862B|nr:phosphoadenosine phosphosulfate reductase [Yoonia sp.]MBE0413013.1 phosphoadenosine phosphosulfate reductase [Yoonia sp.]